MSERAFDIFRKDVANLKAWAGGSSDPSPSVRNGIGALAEIVFARHVNGIIVSHEANEYDVEFTETDRKTVEIKTRLDGRKADFKGKAADEFVQVYFKRTAENLSVVGIEKRTGEKIEVNDGKNPWSLYESFKPYVLDLDEICEEWIRDPWR